MEVYKVLVVILAIYLHRGSCRASALNKIVRRIQDDGVHSKLVAAAWRQKRSPGDEPSCYTGTYKSLPLPSNRTVTVPICKTVTNYKTACFSSMANNNNQRKCVTSHMIRMEGVAFNTACSCAPQNTQSLFMCTIELLKIQLFGLLYVPESVRNTMTMIVSSSYCC